MGTKVIKSIRHSSPAILLVLCLKLLSCIGKEIMCIAHTVQVHILDLWV